MDFRLDVEDSYLGIEDTIEDGRDDTTNEGAELLVVIDGGGLEDTCPEDVKDIEDDEDNLAGFHDRLLVEVLDGDAVGALGEVELVVRVFTDARAVLAIGAGSSFPDCTVHIEERAILRAGGSLGQNDFSLCHRSVQLDFFEALAGEDSHQVPESAFDGGGDDVEVGQGDDGIEGQVEGEQTEDDSEDEVDDGFHCICCF